ncbi:MAG: Spy/CpxP family protein refolding chaperone [Deltaproteobacteria bacterium]|nr:Spy/CpxP family protein refolding chaperone [Deltaproteobacteria bacterium]
MYPGMMGWWKRAREQAHGRAQYACGPGHCGPGEASYQASPGEGQSFGVRRPLRFMAHRLDLDEAQVQELAAILNDLKTERAQAEVEDRRTVSAFAEALGYEAFDAAKVDEALRLRVQSAERLRDAVRKALERTHGLLTQEQRVKLAYLLRSGALTI